ncbi:MAG: hypothetical protein ABSC01_00220, partial [Verrucomicrobiota bacterium]
MKTMRVVSVAGAVLVWAAGIFFDSTFISQAQMQMPPVQAQPDSVVQVMADAEGLQLVPLDQLPKAGTVWTVGS